MRDESSDKSLSVFSWRTEAYLAKVLLAALAFPILALGSRIVGFLGLDLWSEVF